MAHKREVYDTLDGLSLYLGGRWVVQEVQNMGDGPDFSPLLGVLDGPRNMKNTNNIYISVFTAKQMVSTDSM